MMTSQRTVVRREEAAAVLDLHLQPRVARHGEVLVRGVDDLGIELDDVDLHAREVAPGALGRRAAAEPDVEHPPRLPPVCDGELEVVGVLEARLERVVHVHAALEGAVEAEIAAWCRPRRRRSGGTGSPWCGGSCSRSACPRCRRSGRPEPAGGTPATSSAAARPTRSHPTPGRGRRRRRRSRRRARARPPAQPPVARPPPPRPRRASARPRPTRAPGRCRAQGSARTR